MVNLEHLVRAGIKLIYKTQMGRELNQTLFSHSNLSLLATPSSQINFRSKIWT